jgi:hypothetical protein
MANTTDCATDVISDQDELGTAAQRLTAWRAGRLINQVRWSVGRAWILHDRQIVAEARELAAALPALMFELGIDGPEFEGILTLADTIANEPVGSFDSLEHVDLLTDARYELQRESRLGEYPFPSLQQGRCRSLFLAATGVITELYDYLTATVPPRLGETLRLAKHVDEIMHPTSDIAKMFTWQEREEPTTAAMTSEEWRQGTTRTRTRVCELPPMLCDGPAETPQSVDRQWLKVLHGRWQRSPIPDIWCPINAEGEPAAGLAQPAALVTFLHQIAIASLADLHAPPLRWDTTEGTLRVGTETLHRLRSDADRQKGLLQHFEDHRWSTPLSMPARDTTANTRRPHLGDPDVVKNPVRGLNDSRLHHHLFFFRSDGQIGWRWAWGDAADSPNP